MTSLEKKVTALDCLDAFKVEFNGSADLAIALGREILEDVLVKGVGLETPSKIIL